jgi:preprotein translocase subunit SecD
MTNLRWKVVTIIAVFVAFAAVGVYPLVAAHFNVHSPALLMDKQLKLGLDLKGGVHLVLRVQTDDALRLETEQEMERLRQELVTRGVTTSNVVAPDPTHFRIEGVPPAQDAAFRQAATEVQANFDRSSGSNGVYTFTMRWERGRDPGAVARRHRRRAGEGHHPVHGAARTEDRRAGACRHSGGAARQRPGARRHGHRAGRECHAG